MIIKSVLEEDVNESLHFIDSSVNRMAQLIDSILALSRTGRRELRFERLDMNELVRDTLNTLNYKISERGVRVTVGELPDTVADRTSMDQIMANLLGNAVKYLEPGRPGEIEITGHQFPDENVFVVRDNGCGIDQSDASRVFQVFQRVGRQDLPGEGMGLAHVRTLVRRHGGSIWCESVPGAGSTFTFTISSCGLQETNKP